jgi:hypothetical protein
MTAPITNVLSRIPSGYRKAIIVGVVFFVIGLLGAHLLFSWEEWRLSHLQVIYVGPYPKSNPVEVSEIFNTVMQSIVAGLVLLPVMAGAVTTLLLPAWRASRKEAFKSAAPRVGGAYRNVSSGSSFPSTCVWLADVSLNCCRQPHKRLASAVSSCFS